MAVAHLFSMDFSFEVSDTTMVCSVQDVLIVYPLSGLKFVLSNHEGLFSGDGVQTMFYKYLEQFLQLIQIVFCISDLFCTAYMLLLLSFVFCH